VQLDPRRSLSKEVQTCENERKRKGRLPLTHRKIDEEDPEAHETEGEEDIAEPQINRERDSDWNPGSSYLQRKLQSESKTDDVAYQLTSRVVNRSGRETEEDKVGRDVSNSPGSRSESSDKSPCKVETTASHSYNLRSRAESTLGTT
jgi:hypothetical protein